MEALQILFLNLSSQKIIFHSVGYKQFNRQKIEKNYRYIKKNFYETAVACDCFACGIHYKYGYTVFCYFIFNSLTKAIIGTQKHNASELGML